MSIAPSYHRLSKRVFLGFVFYFGMFVVLSWVTIRVYLRGDHRKSSIGIALGQVLSPIWFTGWFCHNTKIRSCFSYFVGATCVFMRIVPGRATEKKSGGEIFHPRKEPDWKRSSLLVGHEACGFSAGETLLRSS